MFELPTAALFIAGSFAPPHQPPGSRGALTPGLVAVTNVTVIPMTAPDSVLRNATVLVRDGRIAAVGPAASMRLPRGARRIDGRGRFLLPGLADMHVHLYSDDETPDSLAGDELGVMIANGVTAVRLMIGTPEHLALRERIEAGGLLGPQLWVASPQLIGTESANARVVTTPDQARAAVKEVADAGYDFVKLTTDITPEVYDAIVAEAARNGIRVIGHVDPRVGVARALAAGQHIEHLDNYLESVLADSAPTRESVSDLGVFYPKRWASLDYVDDAKVERIAGATARARVWTTPTLTMFKQAFGLGQTDEDIRGRPDWAMMPASVRDLYLRARKSYWAKAPSEARRTRWVEVRNRLVKAIADSGGHIMAGSDTPEWFLGYGFTLHRELESLVEAGLTPWQALAAATRSPAEFLHALTQWGTIEPGKRADLVLVSADPLADIRNTTRIEGVAVGGRWLPRAQLDRLVASATRRLGPSD
jgi:imidazolonepropionase-like amidohydrolase